MISEFLAGKRKLSYPIKLQQTSRVYTDETTIKQKYLPEFAASCVVSK